MPTRWRRPAALDSEQLRDYARVLVRAGYLDAAAVLEEVSEAAQLDHGVPEPDAVARELVASAVAELRSEQDDWPAVTDYDRFAAALDELAARGVVTLANVDDHWAATAELERRDERGERVTGIVWFTSSDVWHAVHHGMLELNLWHGDSANVALGDDLLDDVVAVFGRHGLAAHFDEGRVEISMLWQRRQ